MLSPKFLHAPKEHVALSIDTRKVLLVKSNVERVMRDYKEASPSQLREFSILTDEAEVDWRRRRIQMWAAVCYWMKLVHKCRPVGHIDGMGDKMEEWNEENS